VADGVVYFDTANYLQDNQNTVYALDANTGSLIWSYGGLEPMYGSPAVANGMVYVATTNNTVYALNAATGMLAWTSGTGDTIAFSPTVANGLVYVGSRDRYVYAFDGITGNQVWQYETAGAIRTAPAVANGILYVSSGPSIVYALNASNGALIWKDQFSLIANTSTLAGTLGAQSVANSVVYVGVLRSGQSYDLYALNASTGAVIWRSSNLGFIPLSTPAVANGMVYLVAGGTVYALNATTGMPVWQSVIHGSGYSIVAANGVVYAGSWYVRGAGTGDGTITAMDASNGNVLWTQTTTGGYYDYFPSPAVVNGMIYSPIASTDSMGAWGLPN
jgi:outer membrane protein assembly factor BamB